MAVKCNFYNLIVPIQNVVKCKNIGGLENLLYDKKTNLLKSNVSFDDYLFCETTMDNYDLDQMVAFWQQQGLVLTAKKNGKDYWEDMCIISCVDGLVIPCDWLVYDRETWIARHIAEKCITDIVDSRKGINNLLVIPEYRQFCQEHKLDFHLAYKNYEIPQGKISNIIANEYALHEKALSLFNYSNKFYHSHRGNIVSFKFDSIADFSYSILNIREAVERMNKYEDQNNRLSRNLNATQILAFISTIGFLTLLSRNILLSSIIGFISVFWLPGFINSIKPRVTEYQFRHKLKEIQGELNKTGIVSRKN